MELWTYKLFQTVLYPIYLLKMILYCEIFDQHVNLMSTFITKFIESVKNDTLYQFACNLIIWKGQVTFSPFNDKLDKNLLDIFVLQFTTMSWSMPWTVQKFLKSFL